MYKHKDGKIKHFKLEAPGNFYNDEEFISLYGVQEKFPDEYYHMYTNNISDIERNKKWNQDHIDHKITSQFQISCILSHKIESHISFKKILHIMYYMASQFMEKHGKKGTNIFNRDYKTPCWDNGYNDLLDHLKYPYDGHSKVKISKQGRFYMQFLKPEEQEGPSCINFDVNLHSNTWNHQDMSDFVELEMDTPIKRKHITDLKDLSCRMKLIPLVSFSLTVGSCSYENQIIIKLESAIMDRNVPDKINEQGQTIEEIRKRMQSKDNV
jgi:hypothetical protein